MKGDEEDFFGFRYQRAALDRLAAEIPSDEKLQRAIALGQRWAESRNPESALQFSKAVCQWGGKTGGRVWGNLEQYNKGALGQKLNAWFEQVRRDTSDEAAVRLGMAIKGLSVSYASKHLRMLDPQRFATLDAVLEKNFGFARNPMGYALFMRFLREHQRMIRFSGEVGLLEHALFFLLQKERQRATQLGKVRQA